MSTYEARRLENIKRNESLMRNLSLQAELASQPGNLRRRPPAISEPTPKRQKRSPSRPTRKGFEQARLCPGRREGDSDDLPSTRRSSRRDERSPEQQMARSSWRPLVGLPTHDEEGYNHFDSPPSFTPNKSPETIILEGSFGGAYW
ncbi:hypothetical protein F5Y01DRAFT_317912 [Xylaria sp. FL0043]|nr:hypothetical protein F5Y01DRAFT_317912 [Xylaria sp. FL0043]